MDAGYIVGIIGGIAAIVFGFVAFMRNTRQDSRIDAKQEGVILTELGYIKSGVDDIKQEQREQRKINSEVNSKISKNEAAIARAHARIDRLERHEDKRQGD